MTRVTDMYTGSGVQPDDCPEPQCVRIRTATIREFDDGPKIQLEFESLPGKLLSLGRAPAEQLHEIFEEAPIEAWPGKDCVLFRDPSVSFGGKKVGGWRFEAATTTGMRRAQLLSGPTKEEKESQPLAPHDPKAPF